jgi:TrmH family RNA methyltransferase
MALQVSPDVFRNARRDSSLAVLEGFHTLKHALRFDANILAVAVTDPRKLGGLANDLAPDIVDQIEELATVVDEVEFSRLSPHPHPTGVIGIAERPAVDIELALSNESVGPAVLLDQPKNMANIGASIRASAASRARAVVTIGDRDPWDPAALRGSAGLHFAIPVGRLESIDDLSDEGGELIAIDPEGEALTPAAISSDSILVFGSERYGVSDEVLEVADRRLSIPMREGVSSLNLAASVAVVLYLYWSADGFRPPN